MIFFSLHYSCKRKFFKLDENMELIERACLYFCTALKKKKKKGDQNFELFTTQHLVGKQVQFSIGKQFNIQGGNNSTLFALLFIATPPFDDVVSIAQIGVILQDIILKKMCSDPVLFNNNGFFHSYVKCNERQHFL